MVEEDHDHDQSQDWTEFQVEVGGEYCLVCGGMQADSYHRVWAVWHSWRMRSSLWNSLVLFSW